MNINLLWYFILMATLIYVPVASMEKSENNISQGAYKFGIESKIQLYINENNQTDIINGENNLTTEIPIGIPVEKGIFDEMKEKVKIPK